MIHFMKLNKKRLTKIEALEECVRIWSVLRDNPLYKKIHVDGAENYIFECPCCQYVHDKITQNPKYGMTDEMCFFCPLKPLWNNFEDCGNGAIFCEHETSPYAAWRKLKEYYNTIPSHRTQIAGDISKTADKIVKGSNEILHYLYLKEMNE